MPCGQYSKLCLRSYTIDKIVSQRDSPLIRMEFFPQSGMTLFVWPMSAKQKVRVSLCRACRGEAPREDGSVVNKNKKPLRLCGFA